MLIIILISRQITLSKIQKQKIIIYQIYQVKQMSENTNTEKQIYNQIFTVSPSLFKKKKNRKKSFQTRPNTQHKSHGEIDSIPKLFICSNMNETNIQPFDKDKKLAQSYNFQEITQNPQSTRNNSKNQKQKMRKASFIDLQNNKKTLLDKLIRSDDLIHQKIATDSEGANEIQICRTDMYVKVNEVWKNRELKSLTTKKIGSIIVESIKKIKIKSEQPINGYYQFRLSTFDGKVHDLAIRQSDAAEWFSTSIWVCLVNLGAESKMNHRQITKKEGYLLKKGQFLGKWQQRFVSINEKDGLVSSHYQDQKPTLKVKQTTQIWTRLQKIQGDKYVVIKLWSLLFKLQFGIPIQNCESWLRAFSTLVIKK